MSLPAYAHTVRDRFLRYVRIDTQSDADSQSQPSTDKQKNLSRLLVDELQEMGVTDAVLDEHGYVYATIPATSGKSVPTLCFCSHVDTAPDCSGTDVKPLVHEKWDGRDIVLPDDPAIVISGRDHPYLLGKIGDDIVTASGLTLLGADDKAGLAVIMDLAHYLMHNRQVPHGTIRLLFTPDEEIGRGVAKVDIARLGADFAYTLDGDNLGEINGETFSADQAIVTFHGVATHPANGKGRMVHAAKAAGHFLAALPRDEWCPEATEGRMGFVHPTEITGGMEKAVIKFIVRDFATDKLAAHAARLEALAQATCAAFPGLAMEFAVQEQYRNMGDVLRHHPQLIAYAQEACRAIGVTPVLQPIRGGTDGSRLSFMGLPCPNLFTGAQAFHGKQEHVSVQDMEKSVAMLVELVQVWERNAA